MTRLEIYCRTGTWRMAGGGYWECLYEWLTWGHYDTEAEARQVGADLVAGSPRDCPRFRVT